MHECVGMLWVRAQRKWSLSEGAEDFPSCLTSLLRSRPFGLLAMPHSSPQPDASFLPTHSIRSDKLAAPRSLWPLSNSCAGLLAFDNRHIASPLHTPHSTARTQSPTLPRESCRRYRCPHQHYHNARAVLARARSFSCSDWPSFLTSLPPSSSSSLRRRVRFPCPPPSCGGQRCAEERIVGPLFSYLRSRTWARDTYSSSSNSHHQYDAPSSS